jgi:hypothetical protein
MAVRPDVFVSVSLSISNRDDGRMSEDLPSAVSFLIARKWSAMSLSWVCEGLKGGPNKEKRED